MGETYISVSYPLGGLVLQWMAGLLMVSILPPTDKQRLSHRRFVFKMKALVQKGA
jgi:hypothetical protein